VYRIEISYAAHKQIRDLPARTVERINEAIAKLATEPRPPGVRKLLGEKAYRIRVGNYRILFKIDDETRLVRVYRVKHRREAYK
jgi:mRNA interferase RelE/StbE